MTEVARAFAPDWVSPPGSTVADLLEERGWTQQALARRSGFTTKHISLLINGKAPITEDTAVKLERVLGSTMRFWMTREAQYREALARLGERKALLGKAEWLQRLPIKEMVRFGWIRSFENKGDQVRECLRFFGVASVDAWEKQYRDPRVPGGREPSADAARGGDRQHLGPRLKPALRFDAANVSVASRSA